MTKFLNPEDWIKQQTAAMLRGVTRQNIHYLVRQAKAGKLKIRMITIDGLVYLHRDDVMRLEIDLKNVIAGKKGKKKKE